MLNQFSRTELLIGKRRNGKAEKIPESQYSELAVLADIRWKHWSEVA